MSRRYTYDRINGKELSRRLNFLRMSAEELVRVSGTTRERVMKWLDDREDIPPSVDLMTEIFMRHPEAIETARAWAQEVSQKAE